MAHPSKQAIAHWLLPLGVAIICVILQMAGATEALRFERALLAAEPWRLLSGHLVHLGWTHLALNLAGLALIWALVGRRLQGWAWCVALVVCALVISIMLYLRDADLTWYVGLSGVLHGLLVLGALASLSGERRFALLLLVAVAGKLAWEQVTGSDSGTALLVGGAVIVNAHLYGALAGLACAPLAWLGRGKKMPPAADAAHHE